MTGYLEEVFGPQDPKIYPRVGKVLGSQKTKPYIDCLSRFFKDLRDGQVRVRTIKKGAVRIVAICGHVIRFGNYGTIVTDLEQGRIPIHTGDP